MSLIQDERIAYAVWIAVAIGAIHVGALAYFDYDVVVDGLGITDTGIAELVKLGIGVLGAINLADIILRIGEDT